MRRKLSMNFFEDDFYCRCGKCSSKFKISLGIVGALEYIKAHFQKNIKIIKAYQCQESADQEEQKIKNYHVLGKALDFSVPGIDLKDLYQFVSKMPELKGLGLYQAENYLHIDIRDQERTEWIWRQGEYITLTEAKKQALGLCQDQ